MELRALCIILLVKVLFLFHARAQNNSDYVKKADAAFLHVDPNRLQFFEYDSVSLHCGGSSEWRVMKKVSSNTPQWNASAGSLNMNPAFVKHSGEYFCENGEGERGNAVNISVTAGDVILESPALPVREQQTLTLRCRKRKTAHNSPADFFKDGRKIKTEYSGSMIIHNVSSSLEGLYRCSISGAGSSSDSRLAVRAYVASAPEEPSPHPPDAGPIQPSILLPVVITSVCVPVLLLLLLVGLLLCRKHKASGEGNAADATYAVVTKQRKERVTGSTEMPTTASDPMYELVSTAEPQTATYASVTKHKKKRERDNDFSSPSACYVLSMGPGVSSSSVLPAPPASLYHTID